MQLSWRHAAWRRELHADGQRGRRRHTARGSRRIPKNTDGAEGTQVPAVYVHFGT
ncbi:hypothetical protein [Rhodococcus pyridinivorans]